MVLLPPRSNRTDTLIPSTPPLRSTETAVSVPCMFSNMGRKNYDASIAKNEEGLLDVLKRAGLEVIWRDNQSGCKGTCDRRSEEHTSEFQSLMRISYAAFCLQQKITRLNSNQQYAPHLPRSSC